MSTVISIISPPSLIKLFLLTVEIYQHTAISQFLMADTSFNIQLNIACKKLKIAQIAQLNQLLQVLHLFHIYGHGFYELSRMLMRKTVNNDVSKDSLYESLQNKLIFRSGFNGVRDCGSLTITSTPF